MNITTHFTQTLLNPGDSVRILNRTSTYNGQIGTIQDQLKNSNFYMVFIKATEIREIARENLIKIDPQTRVGDQIIMIDQDSALYGRAGVIIETYDATYKVYFPKDDKTYLVPKTKVGIDEDYPPSLGQKPTASSQINLSSRKDSPLFSGVLQYFPKALLEVSRHSKRGNDKHNPGQPLHWAKDKSSDHADCVARHLVDIGPNWDALDLETGSLHTTALAWRALALLQTVLERQDRENQ